MRIEKGREGSEDRAEYRGSREVRGQQETDHSVVLKTPVPFPLPPSTLSHPYTDFIFFFFYSSNTISFSSYSSTPIPTAV